MYTRASATKDQAHTSTASPLPARAPASFPTTCNTLLYRACKGTATLIPSHHPSLLLPSPSPVSSCRTIPSIWYASTFEIVESLLRNQRDVPQGSSSPFLPARSAASSRGFLFTVRFAKSNATKNLRLIQGTLYPRDPRRTTRPGE